MPNKDVGYLIKSINDKLKVKADADLKRFQMTFSQSRVFAFLQEKGGQATQKEIEVFLGVSHPTVVGIVSRMEQNGYLTSWMDKNDRRNKNVAFTEKARALGVDMEQNMRNNEKQLLSPLSPEEADLLKQLLSRICAHLEE